MAKNKKRRKSKASFPSIPGQTDANRWKRDPNQTRLFDNGPEAGPVPEQAIFHDVKYQDGVRLSGWSKLEDLEERDATGRFA